MSRTTSKTLMVLSALGWVLVAGAAPAWSSSDIGTQNPDLTVEVSLASNALDPDRATVGDLVTVTERVTNNTGAVQMPRVVETTDAPGQSPKPTVSRVRIGPHRSYRVTYSYRIDAFAPAGHNTVSLSAENGNGTSSATAAIDII
jgi:uncharacterized protein YfaS (alpha-2-macroglobulin family)